MTKKEIKFLKWSKESVIEILTRNKNYVTFLKTQKNNKRQIKKIQKLIDDCKILLKSYNKQLKKANR